MDDFGRYLGCMLYGLIGALGGAVALLTVLGCLILAGVL